MSLRPQTEYMALERVAIDPNCSYPEIMTDMVAAANGGGDLVAAIDATIKALGFNTFMYGLVAALRPRAESRTWTFTTLPVEWVRRYEAEAFIEIDPRTQGLYQSGLPVIWDQSERGKSRRLDRFLDEASEYGTRSGIALLVPDADHNSCMVAFNSTVPILTSPRRRAITQAQGNLLMFGIHFHELFMKPLIKKGLAPSSQGSPLTTRELETLSWLVKGLSYEEVASQMSITSRTVQAHADSIRSRLNARTLQEAVFLATKAGFLEMQPAPKLGLG